MSRNVTYRRPSRRCRRIGNAVARARGAEAVARGPATSAMLSGQQALLHRVEHLLAVARRINLAAAALVPLVMLGLTLLLLLLLLLHRRRVNLRLHSLVLRLQHARGRLGDALVVGLFCNR